MNVAISFLGVQTNYISNTQGVRRKAIPNIVSRHADAPVRASTASVNPTGVREEPGVSMPWCRGVSVADRRLAPVASRMHSEKRTACSVPTRRALVARRTMGLTPRANPALVKHDTATWQRGSK